MRFASSRSWLSAAALSAALALTPAADAQITVDGTITESDWISLGGNSGAPAPGFGAGHEVSGLYMHREGADLYVGVAGNVQNGNRILVFLDTRAGGFTTGDFGRTGAPSGLSNFNSGTTFDAGFRPDYCLVIGTNTGQANYFVDLFTLAGTAAGGGGSNLFIGDANDPDVGASPANGSTTRGFEVRLTTSADGAGADLALDRTSVLAFAAYTGDSGFLSNQFASPAGESDGNYGGGAVNFAAARPDPVGYVWQTLTGSPGWRHLVWPVDGAVVADLAAQNHVQGLAGSFPEGAPNVLDYRSGDFSPYPNVGGNLARPGRGFFWYHYAQADFPGAQIPAGSNFQPLPYQLEAGGPIATNNAPTLNAELGQFNLGGNPFPLAFDTAEMTVDFGGLGPLVFVYSPTGVEIAIDRNAPVQADRLVAPMQGFWIESTAPASVRGQAVGGPTVTYGLAGRVETTEPFVGRTAAQRVLAFELDRLTPGGPVLADRTARLAFVEGAADGRDAFDAAKPPTLAPDATRLAFLAGGDVRAQDSRAFEPAAEVAATLGLRADGPAADYILRWPTLGQLPAGWAARLIDTQTGTAVDLRAAAEYAFATGPTGGAWAERFAVVVTPTLVAGEPAAEAALRLGAPTPNPASGVARVALTVDRPQHVRAELLDALGRRVALVLDAPVDGARELRVPVAGLAPGAYVLRVVGDAFAESRRLTVSR